MTIKQAKEMDMVDYLSSLGFQPAKPPSGNDYWYLSPLGDERTPSFKVNRALNQWYDFREGKGGNLVDFGILYHQCTVSDLLEKLSGPATIKQHVRPSEKDNADKKSIEILSTHLVSSFPLVKYLRSRRIHDDIAHKYLQEVRYKTGDKTFYALGFKNNSGGYELRNEHFKGSSSPKDVTLINNGANNVAVFEGFFNFLSYQTMLYKQEQPARDFLILNSTSFFEKSLPKMQEYQRVHLYLDNDKIGQNCTQQALKINNVKFRDERALYHNYSDLNDWLVNIGHSQKQQQRHRL